MARALCARIACLDREGKGKGKGSDRCVALRCDAIVWCVSVPWSIVDSLCSSCWQRRSNECTQRHWCVCAVNSDSDGTADRAGRQTNRTDSRWTKKPTARTTAAATAHRDQLRTRCHHVRMDSERVRSLRSCVCASGHPSALFFERRLCRFVFGQSAPSSQQTATGRPTHRRSSSSSSQWRHNSR